MASNQYKNKEFLASTLAQVGAAAAKGAGKTTAFGQTAGANSVFSSGSSKGSGRRSSDWTDASPRRMTTVEKLGQDILWQTDKKDLSIEDLKDPFRQSFYKELGGVETIFAEKKGQRYHQALKDYATGVADGEITPNEFDLKNTPGLATLKNPASLEVSGKEEAVNTFVQEHTKDFEESVQAILQSAKISTPPPKDGQPYPHPEQSASKEVDWRDVTGRGKGGYLKEAYLPPSFNDYSDFESFLPNQMLKDIVTHQLPKQVWDGMDEKQQYEILAPWVDGAPYEPSPKGRAIANEIKGYMEQMFSDEGLRISDIDRVDWETMPPALKQAAQDNIITRDEAMKVLDQMSNLSAAGKAAGGPIGEKVFQSLLSIAVQTVMSDHMDSAEQVSPELLKDISQGLNEFFGMRVNEDGLWRSTGEGMQEISGYAQVNDRFAKEVLGFDMREDTVPFSVGGKHYELRGWCGQYGMLFGGEFGLYSKENEHSEWAKTDDDRFTMDLALYDSKGNKLFDIPAREEKYWQFGGMKPEDIQAYMVKYGGYDQQEAGKIAANLNPQDIVLKGRLTGADADYLQAMATAINEQNRKELTQALLPQNSIANANNVLSSLLKGKLPYRERIVTVGPPKQDGEKAYLELQLNALPF